MKTTNYYNTFIEIAEDCPVQIAEVPQQRGTTKSIANLQYEMISANPYKYTSDEVLFNVYAIRKNLNPEMLEPEKEKFFSNGQPCFRSSPLPKRYGWGVHSNSEGKIALYAIESEEYKRFTQDQNLVHLKAMRSKRIPPNHKDAPYYESK